MSELLTLTSTPPVICSRGKPFPLQFKVSHLYNQRVDSLLSSHLANLIHNPFFTNSFEK